jgi:hypothetical protein
MKTNSMLKLLTTSGKKGLIPKEDMLNIAILFRMSTELCKNRFSGFKKGKILIKISIMP